MGSVRFVTTTIGADLARVKSGSGDVAAVSHKTGDCIGFSGGVRQPSAVLLRTGLGEADRSTGQLVGFNDWT